MSLQFFDKVLEVKRLTKLTFQVRSNWRYYLYNRRGKDINITKEHIVIDKGIKKEFNEEDIYIFIYKDTLEECDNRINKAITSFLYLEENDVPGSQNIGIDYSKTISNLSEPSREFLVALTYICGGDRVAALGYLGTFEHILEKEIKKCKLAESIKYGK